MVTEKREIIQRIGSAHSHLESAFGPLNRQPPDFASAARLLTWAVNELREIKPCTCGNYLDADVYHDYNGGSCYKLTRVSV